MRTFHRGFDDVRDAGNGSDKEDLHDAALPVRLAFVLSRLFACSVPTQAVGGTKNHKRGGGGDGQRQRCAQMLMALTQTQNEVRTDIHQRDCVCFEVASSTPPGFTAVNARPGATLSTAWQ